MVRRLAETPGDVAGSLGITARSPRGKEGEKSGRKERGKKTSGRDLELSGAGVGSSCVLCKIIFDGSDRKGTRKGRTSVERVVEHWQLRDDATMGGGYDIIRPGRVERTHCDPWGYHLESIAAAAELQ